MNCEDTQETIKISLFSIIDERIALSEEYRDTYEADLFRVIKDYIKELEDEISSLQSCVY